MPDLDDVELPRGIALAWGVAANPQRGPKREMSVEQIVDAAVEIADAEGLGAVSMSAVASKLGYTPMSLYRYVSAKDDLMLLMMEQATGVPSESARTAGGWRPQLEALYREQLQRYLEHPWVLDIPISGTPTTPNTAAWMDAGLHALADTPLTYDERLSVLLIVTGHSRWAGTVLAGYTRLARETGMPTEAIAQHEDAVFRSLISADEYPQLRAAIEAGVLLDESDPFAFGLARSLDGVEVYIAAIDKSGPDGRAVPTPWGGLDDADILEDKRFRDARKAVRDAEKSLRDVRRAERQAAREARERVARARPDA